MPNNPFNPPTTIKEHYQNILYDLGNTAVNPTDLHALLNQLDVSLTALALATGVNGGQAPTGSLATTAKRPFVAVETTALAGSGTLVLAGCYLQANTKISNFNFFPGTTGDAGPANQWMGLYNSARLQLATSADATSAAITASTTVTYAVATTAAGTVTSFTTTYTGLYYIGLNITTSNAPTFTTATGNAHVNGIVPILAGTSTTGLTAPTTFPTTATAITATATVPLFWLT